MRRAIVALALGLFLLALGFSMGWARQAIVNTGETADPVEVSPRLLPGLGVGVALQRYDEATLSATLDAIQEAGFAWIRQRFPWDQIEPEPGRFIWGPWDQIVAATTQHGLTLVAVLDGSPTWARRPEDADNSSAPPAQRADFGRFAAAFARRYGDRLRFYQVWEEPNIAPHWGTRPVDAADYAGLLREAAVQLRATDPDATILLAALAPNVEPGGANQSDIAYLEALYTAGAAAWFDAVAGQPYGFEQPPEAAPSPMTLNFRRVELLRQVMSRHGDQAKALWLVTYGWHARSRAEGEEPSPWGTVDPTTQAQWAVDAAEWARRNWPWLGGLAWAWWQPPQPPPDPHWGLALLEPDGKRRPVLAALQDWARQSHPLGPGVWPPDSGAVEAVGNWRLTSQAADPPHQAVLGNNRLRFTFEGTALALRVQRGPYWGYFDVMVDGRPANALPRDTTGRTNLILYDPLATVASVTVAEGLANGAHTAEIVASGGWEQWPLQRIIVRRQPDHPWPGWLPWLLVLGGVVSLTAGGRPLLRLTVGILASILLVPRDVAAVLQPLWARLGVLGILAAAIVLSSGWLQLAAIVLLWVLFSAFFDLALFVLGAVAPLFLLRVTVLGRALSPTEPAVWLAAAALLTRYLAVWLSGLEAGRYDGGHDGQRWLAGLICSLTPLDIAVAALLVVAAASLLVAENFGVASHEFRTVIVAGVLTYGLVRLASAEHQRAGVDPWPVVWGVAMGAMLVAGWGLYQALSGEGVIRAEGVLRVRGPYGSPNNLGLYLGHVLPILLAVAALAQAPARRVAAGLAAALVATALLLTFSKGALLLGLPAAVLFLGLAAGGRWRWGAVAALALSLLMMLPLFRTERFASLFDLQSGTTFLRLQLWRGAWNMILDHPWLGVGLDNFLYAYRTTYVLPTAWEELNLSHPHNILLDFWTRLGLAGVLVGGFLFTAAFRQGWRRVQRLTGDDRALLLGLLASLVATVAHGLIDNSVFLVDLMLLFMLCLGLIARLSTSE